MILCDCGGSYLLGRHFDKDKHEAPCSLISIRIQFATMYGNGCFWTMGKFSSVPVPCMTLSRMIARYDVTLWKSKRINLLNVKKLNPKGWLMAKTIKARYARAQQTRKQFPKALKK